jgi:transposase
MSDVHDVMPAARTILAIDLGKFKSVACVLDVTSGAHRFETIVTSPATVHDLLVAVTPCRLVIEACSVAGWVHDLAAALSVPVQVANTNGEAMRRTGLLQS